MENELDFAELLHKVRKQKMHEDFRFTLREFAEHLKFPLGKYLDWERANALPTREEFEAICRCLIPFEEEKELRSLYEVACQNVDEYVAARKNKHDESIAKMLKARTAIVEALGDEAGEGEMQCPVCGDGILRYSRASNGHIHAVCTSGKCVAWME